MKRIIRVECWADYYFFGKLLENQSLIRKEKNKAEVFKSIKERSKGEFSIGIVDHDNENLDKYIKGFEVECTISVCEEIQIIKIKNNPYYVIQLLPNEFENWIVRYLEIVCNTSLTDFGYLDLKDFTKDSKVIYDRLLKNPRFIKLIKSVLESYCESDNFIKKMKTILEYLCNLNYNADINELRNA